MESHKRKTMSESEKNFGAGTSKETEKEISENKNQEKETNMEIESKSSSVKKMKKDHRVMCDTRERIWDTEQVLFSEDQIKFIDNFFMIELLETNMRLEGKNFSVYCEPENVILERVVNPGENYSTLLAKVTTRFKLLMDELYRENIDLDPLLPTHNIFLILKMVPDGLMLSLKLSRPIHLTTRRPAPKYIYKFFTREKNFYEIMWPNMAKRMDIETIYQSKNYIVPRYYQNPRPYCIFLQDISEDNFQTKDRKHDLDYEHTTVALISLARLHAASIALKYSNMEPSDPFESLIECQMDPNNISFYIYTSGLRVLALEMFTWPEMLNYTSILEDFATRAYHEIIYYHTKFGQLKVFLHGDFWGGNILFKYKYPRGDPELSTSPEWARLIDFQWCQWGSPAIDILNLLYVSVDYDVFKKKNSLIEQYHEAVKEFLKNRFGLNGFTLFPLEILKQDLRNAMLYGLLKGLTMRWIRQAHLNDQSDLTSFMTGECFEEDSYWRLIIRKNKEYLEPFFKLFLDEYLKCY